MWACIPGQAQFPSEHAQRTSSTFIGFEKRLGSPEEPGEGRRPVVRERRWNPKGFRREDGVELLFDDRAGAQSRELRLVLGE